MKKLLFCVLPAVCFWIFNPDIHAIVPVSNNVSLISENQFPGTKSLWKGFVRYDFKFEGRACRIVCPSRQAEGKPWIWNARFPDWHTEIDSILLSEGFYVTNINTDEFNGSPEGVEIWDRYFTFVTDSFKLENKVALEGISRGGLYVYNFAKKYPYRVSCIYCEAPVCDFKSWPGGFGKGSGSPQDWQLILKAYGFRDDTEAKSYKDNPVDNLELLAAEKVPILHMIGLNDSVVPPDENSFILIDRYIRLGGPAIVVPCTKGRQDLKGHHFDIETPAYVAGFIKENTRAFRTKLASDTYHISRGGLTNSALRFEKEKSGRVAFLGGSITYNSGWRDSVCHTIQKRFPETSFEFINAGIPSFGSLPDAFRIKNDLLSKGRIDLLFVEAAVNDRVNGYSSASQIRSMEGIVRQSLASNPQIDIIFLYFVDPDKIKEYNHGIIPAEIQNHEKVAAHYNIPSINLAKEVTERINNKEFTWRGDFIDLHPSRFGQQIYYTSITEFLVKCWKSEKAGMNYLTDHVIPPKLDPLCYENGKLIPVSQKHATEGWIYDENWRPDDMVSSRKDFADVPMLICTTPGKILKTVFKGSAAGIAVASGPDAGIIEYSIDGKEWMKIDLYTQWSASLHLPWFVTLSDDLKNSNHTLRLRLDNTKNMASKGTACRIRYFFFN
jgi:sialidase-1